jgi:predicted dehydrogenase
LPGGAPRCTTWDSALFGLENRFPILRMRLDGPVQASAKRIRWGIVSTGHIASVFAADLRLLADEAEIVAVSSRTLARAEKFATERGIRRAYASAADMAADPDIDVVYVASVHNDHYGSALICLRAGKAVLVEKPLTVSVEEAEFLMSAARTSEAFLMEAVWTRTNPLIRKAVDIVRSGELGEVRHVSASFGFAFHGDPTHRLLDPAQAGGAILDLGVYPVHGVELVLGEPDELAGTGTLGPTGVDTQAAAVLTYRRTGGRPQATALIVCSLETDLPTRLEVFCSRGSLIVNEFIRPEEMLVYRGSAREVEPEILITQLPGGGYTFQAQEVMRCLRTGALESPLVPWASTLASMRTLGRWRQAVAASEACRREPWTA